MQVIENNYKKPSWRTVCPKCKSVLEYDSDDVISHESMFFYLHYIKCPCCKRNIDVEQW